MAPRTEARGFVARGLVARPELAEAGNEPIERNIGACSGGGGGGG